MGTGANCVLLELEGIVRRFGENRSKVLAGIDLGVRAGDRIALTGRSGSGKTTLLNIMAGLDRPDAGRVLFQGAPVASAARWSELRARHIGLVFQDVHLIPTMTVRENVEIAMIGIERSPAERLRRAEALLEQVGLAARMSDAPQLLSGGERQRVAIARSLANRPELMLADEPTGNLDRQTATDIMALMFAAAERDGRALVLVTHDEKLAGALPIRYRLEHGELSAVARPAPRPRRSASSTFPCAISRAGADARASPCSASRSRSLRSCRLSALRAASSTRGATAWTNEARISSSASGALSKSWRARCPPD
jgi:ABC-type lipoprotein export system ATPase subunit